MIRKVFRKIKIEIRFLLSRYSIVVRPFEIPKSIINKYLPKEPVILDIGAHNGADSIEMARMWRKSSIYSFEPVPFVFKLLAYNTRKYKNIHPINLAVGDIDGVFKMYVSEGDSDASSSLLKPKDHLNDHPQTTFHNEIDVQTVKLSTWLNLNKIEKIDLLWLDMQGFEKPMLESAIEILPFIRAIHTEVSTKETYEGVVVYEKFKDWLKIYYFIPIFEAIPVGADMGNVLFVNTKYENKN